MKVTTAAARLSPPFAAIRATLAAVACSGTWANCQRKGWTVVRDAYASLTSRRLWFTTATISASLGGLWSPSTHIGEGQLPTEVIVGLIGLIRPALRVRLVGFVRLLESQTVITRQATMHVRPAFAKRRSSSRSSQSGIWAHSWCAK